MPTNYPPGVTGSEPQIAGGGDLEAWIERIQPGDRCVCEFGDGISSAVELIAIDDESAVVAVDGVPLVGVVEHWRLSPPNAQSAPDPLPADIHGSGPCQSLSASGPSGHGRGHPERRWRICWRPDDSARDVHRGTAFGGPHAVAEQVVADLNARHPELLHWLERSPARRRPRPL